MPLSLTKARQSAQQAARGSLSDLEAVLRSSVDRVFLYPQPTPAAKTTATTLTAAELLSGIITGVSGAGANANYTLPLATSLEAALKLIYPDLDNDDSFDFSLINISVVATDTLTIVTNTGWTLVGSMVVDDNTTTNNSSGLFRARRTAANTYTLYRIG